MLGLATDDCPLTGYCGQYSNGYENLLALSLIMNYETKYLSMTQHSWQFYTNGQVYHNGGCPANGASYAVGDTLGVHMDYSIGKITWYKNGTQTATISGVPTSTVRPLYPVASFSAMGNSVSVKPRATKP